MAVPRNRTSNARKNSRRSHHAKKPIAVARCSHCTATKLPHTVCMTCGYYNDRLVLSRLQQN